MSDILIINGHVIDPANDIDTHADVLISKGIISQVEKNIKTNKATRIDATGHIVSPGFVDLHTHLREPGREDEETIESACFAAAKGGFTTITAMPNTNPVIDNGSIVNFIKERAAAMLVNVEVAGSITKNLEGNDISNMSEMKEAGARIFTDDGKCVQKTSVMRTAMEYANGLGAKLLLHCEDDTLANGGQMNESSLSTKLGLKGIPAQAEGIMVARDIMLSKLTGCPVHITHVSTRSSVELLRKAKAEGVDVTCDVTPHHFSLTEEMLIDYDSNFKMNPPLRAKEDLIALIEGLRDGTVDAIATDHAPHARQEKECEFGFAAFGTIGLETALSAAITFLLKSGKLTIAQIINKLSTEPARILNIDMPEIVVGKKANITVFDPEKKWKVENDKLVSKSKNCAFLNSTLNGVVKATISDGRLAYER